MKGYLCNKYKFLKKRKEHLHPFIWGNGHKNFQVFNRRHQDFLFKKEF